MNVHGPSAMRKIPHVIYHGYVTVGIGADVRRSEKILKLFNNASSFNERNHDQDCLKCLILISIDLYDFISAFSS